MKKFYLSEDINDNHFSIRKNDITTLDNGGTIVELDEKSVPRFAMDYYDEKDYIEDDILNNYNNTDSINYDIITKYGKEYRIYDRITAEDVDDLISWLKESRKAVNFKVDDVEMEFDFSMSPDYYDLYCGEEGELFYHKNRDEIVKILSDIKGALKKEYDKEREYRKNALPDLWKQYTSGKWRNGQYISDFFSDYYKDVFGHRPRKEQQIESEIIALARELNVNLSTTRHLT